MSKSGAVKQLASFIKAYDVRGVVPDQWGPTEARAIGAAMADVLEVVKAGTPVVIGYDMRPSSPELVNAFADGITTRGGDVQIIGLSSTDGLYHASGVGNTAGAMFTASHNPAQYNGIKMTRPGAKPVGLDTGLRAITELGQQYLETGVPEADSKGTVTQADTLAAYAEFLRGLVDLSGIRPLKVVVDAGNGMGGHTVPAVLETGAGLPALPLEIVPLYFELDGTFPNHEANPLEPANLVDLQRAVVKHGADIGLAFDGDADRCFVVDELGEAVNPSAITAMVALREIAKERAAGREATIIHNLICSNIVPETIRGAGATPVRTRVGHSFIKQQMADTGAVFGGEHSAHYYFRDFFFADTGMLAAMHVLAALGEQDKPLSQLMAPYFPYAASGEINSTVADAQGAVDRVKAALAERISNVDTLDGWTFTGPADEPMWWFNLRASNTEPLLRLNVEAADQPTMARIRDEVLGIVRA